MISHLGPEGAPVKGGRCVQSFMDVWFPCRTIMPPIRRGAMMATMRCDHPDIKPSLPPSAIRCACQFQLSVLVSDAFMAAVKADASWTLSLPAATTAPFRPAACGTRSCSQL